MSKFTVTTQLSEQDARRLVDSLESTLMIAGECALGDEQLEDGSIGGRSGVGCRWRGW